MGKKQIIEEEIPDELEEFEFDETIEEEPLSEEMEDMEEHQDDGEPPVKRAKTEQEIEKSRQTRQEQKALANQRKMAKPNAPLIVQAKSIWETLRQKRLTKPERRKLMDEMMALVSGKTKEIIFKHDASRIIQCCLKYATPAQRDSIAEELRGQYAILSQSQYGRFIVSKILNYCSMKYRALVMEDFHGKVRKLIRHKEASLVLDEAYSQFANAAQRSAMMEEFYGPEFAVFKKTNDIKTLAGLIESHPEKKKSLLKYLRETLDSVLQKGSFNLGRTPILHRAIQEYLTFAEPSVAPDMIELLKDHLVHILHTRDGTKIAQYCLLHAGPKDRKHIIKTFKGFVHAMAVEQYGHMVLLSCFDCVDDTVLLGKTLIAELFNPADSNVTVAQLMRDKFANKVFLYLLAGRTRRLQNNATMLELEALDEIRAKTTKKDEPLRRQQLLEISLPYLSDHIIKSCNELLRDKLSGLLILETIHRSANEPTDMLEGIIDTLKSDLDSAEEKKEFHAIKSLKAEADTEKLKKDGVNMEESLLWNRSATSVFKGLLAPVKDNSIASTQINWKTNFCEQLLEALDGQIQAALQQCSENPRGTSGMAYVLVALYENGGKSVQSKMKAMIKPILKTIQSKLKTQAQPEESSKKRKAGEESRDSKSGIETLIDIIF